jgi:hypothetical protein
MNLLNHPGWCLIKFSQSWPGEEELRLEDKGTFHDLDDVFEKAYEETKLPGIISGIALHFINRYINKLRQG